ncbi:MAG: site-specific integrase [Planctomycetota bacterium]|nr:site-specific integrase [Planctomycetota bacterium]
MPHFPKPFFRAARGLWYVQIDGKQVNLGDNQEAAFEQYHRLMATPHRLPPKQVSGELVVGIIDDFLDWCEKHKARDTYRWYVKRTQSFVLSIPATLTIDNFKPIHVTRWIDSHSTWNDGTKRGSVIAVQRAMNWAVQQGLIEKSPIAYFEKPQAGKRERVITADEYASIVALVKHATFIDILTVAWECGPRPQELLRVEARHVDLQNARWVFRTGESKGKRRERAVYLTEPALAITKRLMLEHPQGPIFRNAEGRPWTPYAVNCWFERIKRKLGVKYCLYLFRHSWMTRLLKGGVDPITVSTLAGHVDTSMLARVYAHFSNDTEHLRSSLNRGTGNES